LAGQSGAVRRTNRAAGLTLQQSQVSGVVTMTNTPMKLIGNSIVHFSLAILCAGLAGCASSRIVAPQANGYEEVAHPHRDSTPENLRISFQHRAPNGRITRIWPALYGVSEVIKDNVAIFVGDVAYVSSDPDDPRGTLPRLFAVTSPDLPLDLTDEVLAQWSKANAKDFGQAKKWLSLVTPAGKDGRLELQLEFITNEKDWPDKATLSLDWAQVSALMREVKAKGTVHQDLRWKMPYIAR
jgi:hypothetical protein